MPKKDKYTTAKDTFRIDVIERTATQTADWLTTNQVARLLQISHSSLEKSRCTGRGPFAQLPYSKIGRCVRYSRSDLIAFLDEMTVTGRLSLNHTNGS